MSLNEAKEQLIYSKILNIGMLIGLFGLFITFILYASGIIVPLIPMAKVEMYWVLSVQEYLAHSGIQAGWAWFGNLKYGDMLNFLPIAFLSLLTIVCYISIIPVFIKKKDKAYVIIAIVAASGILGTSSHSQ